MAGGKSKKAGSHGMIECMICKMWVDLESCKGLTEMSQSERNKLVFDCWKCMVDEKVKMADYAEQVIDDMDEGMVIVRGGGNGLLENGSDCDCEIG
ncbi:hypothetical protein FHG87_015083 [Trinorchestia longiramus]|nr:hypothetical protein FHG87_015083 [Trinorchestia longiramus]